MQQKQPKSTPKKLWAVNTNAQDAYSKLITDSGTTHLII